jgi:hypothetical protein
MLRIKQCFKECKLPQADLVNATGWSKGLISRVFSSGLLPVGDKELERFEADIEAFAANNPPVSEWLRSQGLTSLNLLDSCEDGAGFRGDRSDDLRFPFRDRGLSRRSSCLGGELYDEIVAIAGRAAVYGGGSQEQTICLSRAALYLLEVIRAQPLCADALGEIEVAAGKILLGDLHATAF